ncbi:MAG: FAD-binding oxidoreductase [Lysobacterales bacterium]
MAAPNAVLNSLSEDLYLTGDAVGDGYASDWTLDSPLRPDVVFRPRTTEDVSQILKVCQQVGQPLVIQGGRSGLAGGATPRTGEMSLSLERMNQILQVDTAGMTLTTQAGVPLQTLQEHAAKHGLELPLDLGARGSCQAGGIVSTNAGGHQVIQHGMTRALVLGLTAVQADGTVIEANNTLLKNNAGYDLKQLFIGTEGTLGVVTQVTFRLRQPKPATATALCACDNFEQVTHLLNLCARQLPIVCAFEVMWKNYLDAALEVTQQSAPFSQHVAYSVLIQTEGSDEAALNQEFQRCLEAALELSLISDAVVAASLTDADRLWALRDATAEILPAMEPAAVFDVGIPIAQMGSVSEAIKHELARELPHCRTLIFGHIGDGNLHVVASTGEASDKPTIERVVYQHTQRVGGSVSAEHGIGILKKPWLGHSRTAQEIALMQSLKQAMDPKGILNPGRVIN